MKKIYEKGSKWNNEYFDNGDNIIIKISNRVDKLNLVLSEEDYENKYIIRAIDRYKS